MSSKGQTTSKDPKLPNKEVMVTRRKSAQMKRQLRTKDRSMKHITDLLKSPTKETPTKTVPVKKKPSPKAKQSLLQSVQKIQNLPQKTFKLSKVLRKEILLVQDEEYHPNKRKRKLTVNKVVLKPKPNMTVVGEIAGSAKRKYAVPHKASDKTLQPQPAHTDSAKLSADCVKLSMAEAIQIMDEQLTDEDLMEILTCPSPVWWEDPPNEDYIEDALFTRSPPATETKEDLPEIPAPMDVDTEEAETETGKTIPIPNLGAKSDKFLKKRSKLEDLLGNIKDKNNKQKAKASNDDDLVICSNYRANNEAKKDVDSNEIKDVANNEIEDVANNEIKDVANNDIENVDNNVIEDVASNEIEDVANNEIEDVAHNEIEEDVANNEIEDVANNDIEEDGANNEIEEDVANNEIEDVANNETDDVANNEIKKDVAKNREKTETKLSESDDDIILHNSSMNEDELLKDLENMDIPIADDVIVIDDDDDDFLEKPSTTVQESKKEDNEITINSVTNKESSKDTEEVPKNLPALQKCSLSEDMASPKSLDSLSSRTSGVSSSKDIDSISDTNVRFLIEDEEDRNKMVTQDNESNKYNNNESTASDKEATHDSVTVYKIIEEVSDTTYNTNNGNEIAIPNENILNIVDAKLNDYFKKCKKVNQKKIKKETDINKNEMAQNGDTDYSTVSCDKCKPTFKKVSENENVKYCLKCSSIFDSKDCTYCIKKLNGTCEPCKIKFCCASYYKSHTESCSKLRSICKDDRLDEGTTVPPDVSDVCENLDNVGMYITHYLT
ncbi:putative histone-lysine N-methyltransferase 1 [Cydia strobilella]|uniref:putative histone-lysine N-methyltransferase 1 n=1 Tax=Cydia strobilella TaxID=1100964 RepID=UPI003005E80D